MGKFTKGFLLLVGILFLFSLSSAGQFAPPAGQAGTTAINKDSSVFVNWATACVVTRGFINIADTSATYLGFNHANYGVDADATDTVDDLVVSLGDGGSAVLTFKNPIANGPGPDFAVFENGLSDTFLELAFVEVSSDGIHYFRFPAVSNTQTSTQIATFGTIDASKINNFAGKYRSQYGTPFDLDTFKIYSAIDIGHVTHVKIIDAVGCIQSAYASHDAGGNVVNDPWPTPFNTCGFDLDAVGVIHESTQGINENVSDSPFSVYPNPVVSDLVIMNREHSPVRFFLYSPEGTLLMEKELHSGKNLLSLSQLQKGLYIGTFIPDNGVAESKKIIKI